MSATKKRKGTKKGGSSSKQSFEKGTATVAENPTNGNASSSSSSSSSSWSRGGGGESSLLASVAFLLLFPLLLWLFPSSLSLSTVTSPSLTVPVSSLTLTLSSEATTCDAADMMSGTCRASPLTTSSSSSSSSSPQSQQQQQQQQQEEVPGLLRPSDLPGPTVFDSFHTNDTTVIPGHDEVEDQETIRYLVGSVPQINSFDENLPVHAKVTLLPSIVPRETIEQMLKLLREYGGDSQQGEDQLDQDPDTVDAMPTYEIFVDSVELRLNDTNTFKEGDIAPDERRLKLRAQLQNLTAPHLDRLTRFIRHKYPNICNDRNNHHRACTPCYSLIRRYRSGERQSHAAHHDGHALVTAVISLSDYGADYTGGLYVATGHGHMARQFLQLYKGDAAVHQSTLLHGVQVYNRSTTINKNNNHKYAAERWSWILWFRDSDTCQDYSHEWFADCAERDQNALCQQLHASKVASGSAAANTNDLDALSRQIMRLNIAAAHGGAGEAAVKVARAYLKQLPSYLEFSLEKAKKYFEMAIRSSHSPDGHYGMASILVAESQSYNSNYEQQHRIWQKAVYHLEQAAQSFHPFACFNLGMAHVYGYGVPIVNMELGVEWFLQSGLPEGFFVASQYAMSIGDYKRQEEWEKRARILGFDRPWRQMARERTGSGGAGGVDLNLPWPRSVARMGMEPPKL